MKIDVEPISFHALCRECAKEFGSLKSSYQATYARIVRHVNANPGHTVIGAEQTRVIFKV